VTHQVALSREAYQALRKAKRPEESFSDAVLRLLHAHRAAEHDPWKFVRARRRHVRSVEERLAEVEAWRDADRLPSKRR
jgi:predicted CopG family antitoxin